MALSVTKNCPHCGHPMTFKSLNIKLTEITKWCPKKHGTVHVCENANCDCKRFEEKEQ